MSGTAEMRPWFPETSWHHSLPWPWWWSLLAAAAIAAFVYWLYRRERHELSKRNWLALVSLRIAACSLVILMMFGWTRERHRTEPADVVIALDDSASMSFDADSWSDAEAARIKRLLPEGPTKPSRFEIALRLLNDPRPGWLAALSRKYQPKTVLIGESVRYLAPTELANSWREMSAAQPASALGRGIHSILEAQRGRPTAAIILLTDGVTTEGPSIGDIADVARQRSIPLYLVGIGGEKAIRDLRLTDLLADDVAFVDDAVTVACRVEAEGLEGKKSSVRLIRTDTEELIAEQVVVIPKDLQSVPVDLVFHPTTPGEYPLAVVATTMDGEANADNNRLRHHVTVHDKAIRVLLVQAAPSYEYRFLSNLLGRATKTSGGRIFELTTVLQEADRESGGSTFPVARDELFAFDTVIIGDADPAYLGPAALNNLVAFVQERGGGVALWAGPRFMPSAFQTSALASLFPFDPAKISARKEPAVEPFGVELAPLGRLWPACQLTPDPDENARLWQSLPGLYWKIDIVEPNPAARVILQHASEANSAGKKLPLAMIHFVGAGKVLFHATDETYRWARHEGSDAHYSRYWLQTLRYLSRSKLQSNRAPAEIILDRQNYVAGEAVSVRVRFWQPGLAPADGEGITVVFENQAGRREKLVLPFEPGLGGLYSGSASSLPPGSYRVWLASPVLDPSPIPRSFTVVDARNENAPRPVNTVDLKNAAKTSGGRYFTLANVDRLLSELPQGQRVRIETLPPESKWNDPAIAAIFVILLTAEWLLRRRAGLA